MDMPRKGIVGRRTLVLALVLGAAVGGAVWAAQFGTLDQLGPILADRKSEYSHIRIRQADGYRSLIFVRDSGDEVVETMLNLRQPYRLVSDYTKFMFLSYLFRPQPERVLIVGLGGGAMVHFMRHHDRKAKVDVVEIDPVVVELAAQHFGIKPVPGVEVITADGLKHIAESDGAYDVIFMDAFLKPTRGTDTSGVPLELKTRAFFDSIKQALRPDGVVVFNINPHPDMERDVEEISASFPQTYVYQLPNRNGLVVIGSQDAKRVSFAEQMNRARKLDARFRTPYSFVSMAQTLAAQNEPVAN